VRSCGGEGLGPAGRTEKSSAGGIALHFFAVRVAFEAGRVWRDRGVRVGLQR
jgi:hypothetical protein